MVEEFLKFVSNYYENRQRVQFKKEHTLRVRNLCIDIAKNLNMSEKEIELAGLIGLLHDVGRFEQDKIKDDFSDLNGFDHAEYGADMLFKKNMIKNHWQDEDSYSIIEFAIRNHNKYSLPIINNKSAMIMTKIIRDADKIDIIYHLGVLGHYDKKGDNSDISSSVLNSFKNKECVRSENIKTNNDDIASVLRLFLILITMFL